MLSKRLIPCLDVKENKVVKGVGFKNHQVVGDILELTRRYCAQGADELVFYDITASSDNRCVEKNWVRKVSKILDIPFCVAGGIRTVDQAKQILENGADKISINSPALENPDFINELVDCFGSQCVVVGIDSFAENGEFYVYQYTGSETRIQKTKRTTLEWANEVEKRGAGEIVLNCMNQDGLKSGYDIQQLKKIESSISIPIIASGGAGKMQDFLELFQATNIQGALAASVFHNQSILIPELKQYLFSNGIEVRRI